MCKHEPHCPAAESPDHDAALVVADHSEQGWWLLCNGMVCFDDTGELFPDGHAGEPRGRCTPRVDETRTAA